MTSRILQEDSGLILTQASDILVNNNFIGVDSFSTGAPVLQTATMSQVHGLLCTNILTGTVVVEAASIAQNHDLSADLILTGVVVVADATLVENIVLSATGIITGSPVVANATMIEDEVSTATPILTGPPVVEQAELTQSQVFIPYSILTGRPDIESAPDPNAQYEEVVQQMFGGWPKRIYEHTDLSIARGHSTGYRSIYKFGYNPDLDATEETIWGNGGNYPWFANELTVFISSTSANDTGTGTGARTVLVQGLDENYNEIEETLTLNGQAQVTSQLSYLRIYRAYVTLAGSGANAAGTVYLGASGSTGGVPTTVYASLSLGNQTQIAAYTVPAGHTLYVDDINFTAAVSQANKTVTCSFHSRDFNSNVFRTRFINVLQSNQLITKFKYAQAFTEKTDLECRAYTDTTNTAIGASFQGVLIKNET
jgi:hypothetical protein